MIKDERIYNVLSNYRYIAEYLGNIIENRLNMPNYENNVLISKLSREAESLPASILPKNDIYEYRHSLDEEDFYYGDYDDDEYYDDEFSEKELPVKNVSGLRYLDKTLFYGKKYCKEFENIITNISFKNYGEADSNILNILSRVKCFEFLSKSKFRDITAVDKSRKKEQIDFIARIPPSVDYYAIAVNRFLTTEDISRYDERQIINFISSNVSNAIRDKSPKLEHFCKPNIGINKGIIFISSGLEYFSRLFNLPQNRIIVILNKNWIVHKANSDMNKYFHNLIIMTDKNVRNAIVYPSLN